MLWKHDKAIAYFPNRRTTAEHLIPKSEGGRDTKDNIVAACKGCNAERGNMPIWRWVEVLRKRLEPQHLAALLRKVARFGISFPIGQPEQSAPIAVTADSPPPQETAPAP